MTPNMEFFVAALVSLSFVAFAFYIVIQLEKNASEGFRKLREEREEMHKQRAIREGNDANES